MVQLGAGRNRRVGGVSSRMSLRGPLKREQYLRTDKGWMSGNEVLPQQGPRSAVVEKETQGQGRVWGRREPVETITEQSRGFVCRWVLYGNLRPNVKTNSNSSHVRIRKLDL